MIEPPRADRRTFTAMTARLDDLTARRRTCCSISTARSRTPHSASAGHCSTPSRRAATNHRPTNRSVPSSARRSNCALPTLGVPPDDIERVVETYRDAIRGHRTVRERGVRRGRPRCSPICVDAGYVLVTRHRQTATHGDPDHRTLRVHRLPSRCRQERPSTSARRVARRPT